MEIKYTQTEKAPAAIGPYSQAVSVGNLLFTSGQIPLDPATGAVVEGGVEAQAEQVMKNLAAVLEEAGSGLDNADKPTGVRADLTDVAAINEVFARYVTGKPARSCVAVRQLPKSVLVEVEVIAELG